jgi:hypothetical protein
LSRSSGKLPWDLANSCFTSRPPPNKKGKWVSEPRGFGLGSKVRGWTGTESIAPVGPGTPVLVPDFSGAGDQIQVFMIKFRYS